MKSLKIFTTLIVVSIFLSFSLTYADDDIDKIRSRLPKLLGSTNVGNDFRFTIPPCYDNAGGGHDNCIRIFVASMFETTVTVEVPGKGFKVQKKTIPNDVIDFSITPTIGQCYLRSPSEPSVAEAIYSGYGLHLYSSEPVIVYCAVSYYGTSDGFLVLPVSTLGDEYIVASYGDMGAMWEGRYPSLLGIVAAYDNTKVSFTLGGNESTVSGGGMQPGQTSTEFLNKGDVWIFSSDNDEGDLTGSKITSSKPVAVVSGNYCANVPTTNKWCDYIVGMDQPTNTWGLNYHIAKIPGRLRSPIIRVFAKEARTKVYRDGNAVGYIKKSGGIISEGYLEMRLTPFEDEPESVVISGDKPINVVLYNTGVEEDGDPLPNSAPFMMNNTPLGHYYNNLVFCTPGTVENNGFDENYLNIVYESDQSGAIPEDMEFARVEDGNDIWVPLSLFANPGIEKFSYNVDGKNYATATISLPGDAVYKVKAEKPFAAYTFGYSWCCSYGYPAADILLAPDLSGTDTVPPLSDWSRTAPDLIEGTASDTNSENSSIRAVFFHESASENCSFSYDDFIPGEAKSISWQLKISDTQQSALALVTFADQCGNDTTVKISYSAPQLELTDQVFNYGTVDLGKTYEQEYTLTNLNTEASQHIENIGLEFGNRGYILETPELPLEIAPLDSVKFKVTFVSDNPGTFVDRLLIQGRFTPLFDKTLIVQASDIYQPKISVTDINFGNITVAESDTQEFTISNIGDDELIIYGYSGPENSIYTTDLPEFSEENTLTIKAAEQMTFNVTASPDKVSNYDDAIQFQSNAATEDNTCSLSLISEAVKVKKVYVSDIDFELIDGLSENTHNFFVRNTGNDVLNVNGFTGPAHDFISIEGPALPAQVEESGQLDFTVTIKPPDLNIPEFRDTIYFDTDAAEGDTMLVISAVVRSDVKGIIVYDYGILLYPLPANEYMIIENSEEFFGKTMLKVSDIEGKIMLSREMILNPGEKFKLDVTGLSTGTYMLQMEAGRKIFTGKITIER